MVKTNHLGALAATAGTLVAVGLLMLMMVVVEVRSAEATFPSKHNVGGGGGSFNVTHNTTNDYTPSYSPAGKKIAYRGSGSNGRHNEIYTINVGGGVSFDVTDYTINAGGGGSIQVTHNTMDDQERSYSPSGKRIAYSGWDGHDGEIYTINVDGSGGVQLTHNTTKDGEPSYSPDGKRI